MGGLDVEAMFLEDGALLEGHFVLRSGMHSSKYLQCAKVLQHPGHAEKLAKGLAEMLGRTRVDTVVGPATGGIIVAYELARALGCRGIFAERVDDVFALRRGFEVARGNAVVVAEDVITTGGAAEEVVRLVEGLGARAAAVAALVNRSGKNPFAVPFHYLFSFEAPTWNPAQCPLCRAGRPVEKPGSRQEVKR